MKVLMDAGENREGRNKEGTFLMSWYSSYGRGVSFNVLSNIKTDALSNVTTITV